MDLGFFPPTAGLGESCGWLWLKSLGLFPPTVALGVCKADMAELGGGGVDLKLICESWDGDEGKTNIQI